MLSYGQVNVRSFLHKAGEMQPLLREIGQLRQPIYDPNCEMAHRQEPFSLVVLGRWPLLGGLDRSAPRGLETGCVMKFELTKTQLCYGPSVFVFRRIVMRGFNRTALWCASLIFESTLSG
jgi:hypothetical protein